ncbi:MAG: histidine phosphatase family protein, partial [Treponema sp.]|nr:histidine phosphatase family protein [Treponema sp.]
MQLLRPNEWMTKAASELPDDKSAVLFMRHCERYTDPPDGDYSKLLLNPNGIKMANDIGASINRKIRLLRSSPIERCKQTIREIIKFVPQEYAPDK